MSFNKISLAALAVSSLFVTAAVAAPVELLANGGFETGTLASWTTSGLGVGGTCPGANRDWNVASSGGATGCSAVADPSDGAFAVYAMGDGTGPLTYRLSQLFTVAAGTVGGTYSFDLSSINQSDAGRTLTVSLTDQITLASINLYSASTLSANSSWQSIGGDVSIFLAGAAGNSVLLSFDNFIPTAWSGPAGLGVDQVSILAEIPEPASLSLLALSLVGLGFIRCRKSAQG